MEIIQLKYFLYLANVLHVTKAAEHFNISQPALSATIKRLENEVGCPLFIRKGRGIELSEGGKVFKRYVQDAMDSLENGKRALNLINGYKENNLALAMESPYIWKDLISEFQAKYDKIKINLYSLDSLGYVNALIDESIDFYLGGINNFNEPKLEYATLYTDEMVILANKANPISDKKNIYLSECSEETIITLNKTSNLQQFIVSLMESANFYPKQTIDCDYSLRDDMVIENYGISITTRLSAKNALKNRNLRLLRIADEHEKRKLGVVWKKGIIFSKPMSLFMQHIQNYYK